MKHSALALALGFAATTSALILAEPGSSSKTPVNIAIQKQRPAPSKPRRRRNRIRDDQTDDTLETDLAGVKQAKYFAKLSIGSPAQDFNVQIDTGSSDLWVNTGESQFCSGGRCSSDGLYSANKSDTYKYLNSEFSISYVDGSGAKGDYITDTVTFQDVDLKDFQLGVAYKSSAASGILGIGFVNNEASVVRVGTKPYPNLSQRLVDDGVIETNAFSLYLNDLDADSGNILYGGIDTEKFHGELVTVPMVPSEGGEIRETRIALTAVGTNKQGGNVYQGDPIPVVLDSGAAISYLPADIAAPIIEAAGAYQRSGAIFVVPCELKQGDDTIDFEFAGKVTINVPLEEMVIQFGDQCVLGISAAPDPSSVILGDTFLRSAYAVYDLTNKEISLANTKFNSTDSKIVAIKSGGQGVPDGTSAGDEGDFAIATYVPRTLMTTCLALSVVGMAAFSL